MRAFKSSFLPLRSKTNRYSKLTQYLKLCQFEEVRDGIDCRIRTPSWYNTGEIDGDEINHLKGAAIRQRLERERASKVVEKEVKILQWRHKIPWDQSRYGLTTHDIGFSFLQSSRRDFYELILYLVQYPMVIKPASKRFVSVLLRVLERIAFLPRLLWLLLWML